MLSKEDRFRETPDDNSAPQGYHRVSISDLPFKADDLVACDPLAIEGDTIVLTEPPRLDKQFSFCEGYLRSPVQKGEPIHLYRASRDYNDGISTGRVVAVYTDDGKEFIVQTERGLHRLIALHEKYNMPPLTIQESYSADVQIKIAGIVDVYGATKSELITQRNAIEEMKNTLQGKENREKLKRVKMARDEDLSLVYEKLRAEGVFDPLPDVLSLEEIGEFRAQIKILMRDGSAAMKELIIRHQPVMSEKVLRSQFAELINRAHALQTSQTDNFERGQGTLLPPSMRD